MRLFVIALLAVSFQSMAARFVVFENKLYELNMIQNTIGVYGLNSSEFKVLSTSGQGATKILIDKDHRQLIVLCKTSLELRIFKIDNLDFPPMVVRIRPDATAMVFSKEKLFIAHKSLNHITVFLRRYFDNCGEFQGGYMPRDLDVSGDELVVSSGGNIWFFDVHNHKNIGKIDIKTHPMKVLADKNYVYTLEKRSAQIHIFDRATGNQEWEYNYNRRGRSMVILGEYLMVFHGIRAKLDVINRKTLITEVSYNFGDEIKGITGDESNIYLCFGAGKVFKIPLLPNRECLLNRIKNKEHLRFIPKKLVLFPLPPPVKTVDLTWCEFADNDTINPISKLSIKNIFEFLEAPDQLNLALVSKHFRSVFMEHNPLLNPIFADFIECSWKGRFKRARNLYLFLIYAGYKPVIELKDYASDHGFFGAKCMLKGVHEKDDN